MGGEEKKQKEKNMVRGWWEKNKKNGQGENIQTGTERMRKEEENEKGRHFGNCEKKIK